MTKHKTVLITGVTGLVGSYLSMIMLKVGYTVYALARPKDNISAADRVRKVLGFWDEDVLSQNYDRLRVLKGDISEENLGLCKQIINMLKCEVDEIFHCAAMTQFNAELKKLRKVNLEGTRNICEICRQWMCGGNIKKINYLSTAFICGSYKGLFNESDFDLGQKFNNNYEQSKFEAESLVRQYMEDGMQVLIFRPSIVVGDYISGRTMDFKMFYEPLHLFSLEMFPEVPVDIKTSLNVIPVDLAAQAIYTLSANSSRNGVYHITSPTAFPIDHVINKASSFFNFDKPAYVDMEHYKVMSKTPASTRILDTFKNYFNFRALFGSDRTQTILREYGFEYPPVDDEFLYRIFKFCSDENVVKVKEGSQKL